jgi:hypothetical protein
VINATMMQAHGEIVVLNSIERGVICLRDLQWLVYNVKAVAQEQRIIHRMFGNNSERSLFELVLFIVFLWTSHRIAYRLMAGGPIWRCSTILTNCWGCPIPHIREAPTTNHRVNIVRTCIADIMGFLGKIIVRVVKVVQ